MTALLPPPPPALRPGMVIEEMSGGDLKNGFLETLSCLAETGLTLACALRIFQERLRAGHRTYVVKVADRVVATATLLLDRKFIHGGGLVGHLEDVAVHPDWQGRGLGTALVEHMIDAAEKLGCYKLILNCHDALVPFYQRCHFHTHDHGMRRDFPSAARR